MCKKNESIDKDNGRRIPRAPTLQCMVPQAFVLTYPLAFARQFAVRFNDPTCEFAFAQDNTINQPFRRGPTELCNVSTGSLC